MMFELGELGVLGGFLMVSVDLSSSNSVSSVASVVVAYRSESGVVEGSELCVDRSYS